jgi:hypothetical protein
MNAVFFELAEMICMQAEAMNAADAIAHRLHAEPVATIDTMAS